ncbi:MAG: hypothetical protein AAGG51_02095 [Cyanobacteria bacterium P01_G01_bin.54]
MTALIIVLCGGLIACSDSTVSSQKKGESRPQTAIEAITETAPPLSIRTLTPLAAVYEPQVKIVTPRPNTVLDAPRVEVSLAVQDLPVFKDTELELGPHLQIILDNQPPVSVYSLADPIILEDVAAGTHLLRVFAVTPWGESFKNEGAYAQTQFSVLTGDRNHQPNPNLPLLTYNSPQGRYSAQPLLLDFFLSNAPLRWVEPSAVKSDSAAAINTDWRIRVTVNDQSFLLDDWQSLYLEGFKPGLNWVKLEFLGATGQPIDNVFNNTVRIVDYQPDQTTPLAALITNAIAPEVQGALLNPMYRERTVPTVELQPETPAEVSPEQPPDVIELDTVESDISIDAGGEEDDAVPSTEPLPESQTPDLPVTDRGDLAPAQEDDSAIPTDDTPAETIDAATEEATAELEPPLLLDEQGVPVVAPKASASQKTAQPEPAVIAAEDEIQPEEAPEEMLDVALDEPTLSSDAAAPEVTPEAAAESTPAEPIWANPMTAESIEPSLSSALPTPEP